MNKIFLFIITATLTLFSSEVEVTVITPSVNSLPLEVEVNAVVVPKIKIAISSKSSGILHLYIFNDTQVKKGDVLAKVVDERRIQKIQFLKTKLLLLENQLVTQKNKIKISEEKFQMGVGSKSTYFSEKIALNHLNELMQNTKNDYETLILEENNSEIIASSDGFVNNVAAEGTYINYGTSIANLVIANSMVKLFADLSFARSLSKGMKVDLLSEYQNTDGVIRNILLQTNNNLMEIMVEPQIDLPQNLRLKAKIILKNVSGLNIPKNAVVIVENHPAVYVIENGIAHLKYLDIITDQIDRVLVKNTLGKDVKIAVKNAYMLHDGLEVVVK
jgi:multidrug efflux pump subunit AcrA (membrane-fusion protein)